ncbi:hypothetical protein PMAYCL1PPCAC_23792, partial [Pristionchus mayeri]
KKSKFRMTKQRRKRKLEGNGDQERDRKKEVKITDQTMDLDASNMEELIGIDTILPTRQIFAEQLMVLLKSNDVVLIEGDVGCGKTFISKHVALQLRIPSRIMQMGDQLDSKSLMGSYECTEVAGNFKWKKSKFHEWLVSPGVIVIEDIDTGNADVITSLLSISTSRRMVLPTGETVNLHPHCHLVATMQSTRLGGRRNGVLEGLHSRISLPSLSDDELKRLGSTIYPRIAHLVKAICKIFRELNGLQGSGNSRKLTTSDMMRALKRVNDVEDISSSQAILLELMDVWCMSESSMERRQLLISSMAPLLSLTIHEVESCMTMRTPSLHLSERSVSIGRVSLHRRSLISTERSTKLGHTKGALQLLERMAQSVKMEEAVLLVGESGVGKTSLVQVLADMRGEKLATVNLGPHTDTDDLITSLRPTTFGRLMEPFTRDFVDLFMRSFDPAKNEKFLHNLEVFLMHHKYDEYLRVVEETAKRILSKKREWEWADVVVRCRRLKEGLEKGASPFALQRGIVKEAADEGYWLLIDEINLATPECLDAIVDSISSRHHPSFRLFACMNPATDTAKRRLPEGIRSRFTEYYVPEDANASDLTKIVSSYLPSASVNSVDGIVKLYMDVKRMHPLKLNLRTLTRALSFAGDGRFDSENRCLYEAFSMAFLSNMECEAKESMSKMISTTFPCEKNTHMRKEDDNSVMIEGYEIERGESLIVEDHGYILTPTVKKNLREVARIVSSKRLAVLLEGETSAGKTSIVVHLAKITGNVIRRINNHEQTDVQEYLGSYVPDSTGRLHFREGPLVEAVRKGYWVILDELNLAPSDVIETLNRLLDDNRELMIPESSELIKAHPRFRLFATQNPAGSYAGRKRLSRALLSRFVVLLFPILPLNELSQMVCARCEIAPSAADKMIRVLLELRMQRSLSGLFSSKDGLMTLRDVFRWGHRLASDDGSDWQAAMLHHGFFLLGGRCRSEADKSAVINTLENVLRGKIDEKHLFSLESPYFPRDLSFDHVILTYNMRRMLVLSWQALLRNEAVLVVGETGDGKTRLAQTLGGETMMSINCHERTECSDLLGRLRPAANGGFEWQDGVVIKAMKEGKMLLMDEISLAEDSVLERLNPLFEDKRTILLTDSGANTEEVRAEDTFKVVATMNPGGDYGKKELSKALRNRFTEIWSCSSFERSELCRIFAMRMNSSKLSTSVVMKTASIIIHWINQLYSRFSYALRVSPSLRDIVACADMWSALCERGMGVERAVMETLSSVFVDAIPCQMTRSVTNIKDIQMEALQLMEEMLSIPRDALPIRELISSSNGVSIGTLSIPFGPLPPTKPLGFSFSAPTCMENMYRVMRALYINKPVLLEGSPGCGKSTLIMALASIAGYPCTRLNLSEQTDLSDLFGSDIPIVNEEGVMSFEWKDGPILKAIKNGEWILLDEMNLASQSILEGLNACFDHRRVVYIAELAKEFEIPSTSSCRFFACQNPRGEGGNRRALPKSFVNRFTNIYTNDLTEEDELAILREVKSGLDDSVLSRMVKINVDLSKELWTGGPFSFNLRDLSRWMHMISKSADMGYSFECLYVKRLRVEMERERAREIFKEIMKIDAHSCPSLISIDENTVRIGPLISERKSSSILPSLYPISSQASTLLSVMNCLSNGWITLLIGPRNSGKRSISETAASLIGVPLEVITLSNDTDASELIGSFEQRVDEDSLARLLSSLSSLLSPYVENLDCLKKRFTLEKVESEVELMLTNGDIPLEVREEVRSLLSMSLRSEMYFEWVDSPFVRAYTQGKLILIENVNQCNSAVLDRLNTSLESGGSLVLSESRGDFQPISPHPDFRVIMSMDAMEGEISRAMRNRSVEIFMGDGRAWNEEERDVHTILTSLSGRMSVSRELAASLVGLPFRTILFSGLMLSHYEERTVAKLANRPIDDRMSEGKTSVESVVPRLSEWTDGEKISTWMISLWKKAAEGEHEQLCLPLLPLLASSTNIIQSKAWKKEFGMRGTRMAEKVMALIPSSSSSSNHPIDPSFHGDHTVAPLHNLSSSILVEWLDLISCEMEREEGSALAMCLSLSLYEMTVSPFYFDGMESSDRNYETIRDSFARAIKQMTVHSEMVFPLCLSIFSLFHSLSRCLSTRSGESRVRIAYSNLKKLIDSQPTRMDLIQLEAWSIPNSINSYLSSYNDDRLMDPFAKKEQLEILKEAVQEMRHTREEAQGARMFFSLVTALGRKIEKIVAMNASTHHMICMNHLESGWMRVMECLPWKEEEGGRKSVMASLLSMDLTETATLSSLLAVSPVTFILSYVWQQLGWDSRMRCIAVRNLRDLSFHSFLSQVWRIGANSGRIADTIRKSMILIGEEERSCLSLMSYGLDLMEKALPPLSSLDPVIYGEESVDILKEQLNIVDGLIQSLIGWRRMIDGEGYMMDETSTHPFIKSLFWWRNELREKMTKMEIKEERMAYREESKQYHSMCREMHSLFKLCLNLNRLVGDDKWRESQDLQLMSSHVSSAKQSARSFLEDALLRFGSLVDVMGGFWNGVWIVYLSLNILDHEMELHSLHHSLMATTAFPRHLEASCLSWLGPIRNSMVEWAIRASSPLPLDLQAALVEWKICNGEGGAIEIEWTRNQWRKWYEKNTTRENVKLFEYREKSMEEKEEMEMEEMFGALTENEGAVGEETLVLLLHSFTKKKEESEWREGSERLVAALAYLSSLTSQCGGNERWKNCGLDASLYTFSSLYEESKDSVVDVYREICVSEVKESIEECMILKKKTEEFRDKWPEVQSLSLIIEAIESLMDSSLAIGQMRMAERLEKIIEEAEEWEKLADRCHSLDSSLLPLRERLVKWKKMEIVSWSRLVHRVQRDSEDRAALVAFPLFDALLNGERSEEEMMALACDWISQSCLIDFHQRLRTVQCLARWAHYVEKENMRKKLCCVVGYFEQLRGKVDRKLKEITDPIERLMKDLVKIAQYKDLNILSIKASSKRNHIQLFKLVKRLKNEGGTEISGLMDDTLDIEEWKIVEKRKEMDKMERRKEKEGGGIVKRAREIANEIVKKREEILDAQSWIEMGETIDEVRKHCETRIVYCGSEKEMESQQGRERNSRQREVALVIKESQGLGVSSRRGMTLNSEDVSRRTLTEIDPSIGKRKNIVRAIALARSIMIRRGMQPNEQLSTSTRGHLLGMVEYGCEWMVENEKKIEEWKMMEMELERLEEGLRNEHENVKRKSDPFNHRDAKEIIFKMKCISDQIHEVTLSMKMRMKNIPCSAPQEGDDWWSPLSRLSSTSEELPRVLTLVHDMRNLSERLHHQVQFLIQSGASPIYLTSNVDSASRLIENIIEEWKNRMEELMYWFDGEGDVLNELLSHISTLNKDLVVPTSESLSFSLPTQLFLLFIQRLYKITVERSDEWRNRKEIDMLTLSSSSIIDSRPDEVISLVSSALDRVSNGERCANVYDVSQLLSIARSLFHDCVSIHKRCSHGVAVMLHRLAELGIHLMEKGYLNTIPKEEKEEEGEGKEMDGEEGGGGGMGEGKGSKDVTEEMEETGQIEGLQGDEEEEDGGGESKNEKNERPIEMEEDFAKDIEDVDKGGESGDEDEEDGEEPRMDDGMGEVDEKEEEEVDPHLWDDEEKEENNEKKMDDDNKGADEKTGEMSAKEDKEAEMREEDEKKEEEAQEGMENEKEEEEDCDMENMDKNERENKEEVEGAKRDEEYKDVEESREEERMELGENAVDEEEEEDDESDKDEEENGEDGADVEEECSGIDEQENENMEKEQANTQMTEEVDNEQEKEDNEKKKMESGDGGENEEDEEGGGGEKEEKEDMKSEEEKGENGGNDDEQRKDGIMKERDNEELEDKKRKEKEEDGPIEEEKEKKREIMMDEDKEIEEESEVTEADVDEKGEERKENTDRHENDRMMIGAGTMEEAKESMKSGDKKNAEKKKEKSEVSAGDIEMSEDAEEPKETMINFNPLDIMALTDKLTKELVMGAKKEAEDEIRVTKEKEIKEKSEEETIKCRVAWERMAPVVSLLAAELSENLRLILEPRLATRMEGDYRTGKRLNMKRIIPYIASQYRKNRIWMRRTKKAERNYQVLIAVDDSASMAENGMESLTCASCVIEEALRRVNAGQLSIITFGETIEQLIPFSHASSTQSTGECLLSSLSFDQSSTDLCGMLKKASDLLEEVVTPKSEQMLIIISDGRGALANGVEKIREELCRLSRVSVLFLILDCGKQSIREMKVASFVDDQVQLIPYLSLFPFPLYVLAQSVTQIPSLMAEALRQWIEYGSQQ